MRNQLNSLRQPFLFLLGIFFFFTACETPIDNSEEVIEEPARTFPLVDEDLWPHFINFEEEAALRGYQFDLNLLEVTGFINDIPRDGVAGTCRSGSHTREVTVDVNFWNNSGRLRRELVVFHELGHCVLFQDHREQEDQFGRCLSLMNSGTSGCNVPYDLTTREFYIDELFAQWE